MKIQIKALKPNPFRDMENYPINEEKAKSLTNSINQTGFWDNILARPKPNYTFMTEKIINSDEEYDQPEYMHIIYDENGEEKDYDDPIFEIAYGHHRLIVLQKLFKPDDYVDIPVKELDDSTMIRIMANENDENWGTSPKIIDETVRATIKFLEEHLEIAKEYWGSTRPMQGVPPAVISRFLNGNWSESRVYYSLERLGLIKKGELDKEAVESYPTERSARNFVKAVKQIKNITPEQQHNVAKRMVENQSFGESAVKSELLNEKYKGKKTEKDKEEKQAIEYKFLMTEFTRLIKSLNDKFVVLNELERKYNLDFSEYKDLKEAIDFRVELNILIGWLKKYSKKGGEKNNGNELLQISD